MSHRCPTKGCKVEIRDDAILMCKPHWYELMREERDAIHRSYRQTGGGPEHIAAIHPILERQAVRMNRGED